MQKISRDKKGKKTRGYLPEENYLVDLQQENCLDGQTKGTIRNIGLGQREFRKDGREDKQDVKKQQKWLKIKIKEKNSK